VVGRVEFGLETARSVVCSASDMKGEIVVVLCQSQGHGFDRLAEFISIGC
jgi:hypothetical protein